MCSACIKHTKQSRQLPCAVRKYLRGHGIVDHHFLDSVPAADRRPQAPAQTAEYDAIMGFGSAAVRHVVQKDMHGDSNTPFKNQHMPRRRRWTAAQRADIARRQSNLCAGDCGLSLPRFFHLDHIVPFAFDPGLDIPSNLQALCGNCHAHKTGMEASLWTRRRQIKRACKSFELCFQCGVVYSSYWTHACESRRFLPGMRQ